ncbi:protein kinase [bacterium]|nr:protein kinase [bacterium]
MGILFGKYNLLHKIATGGMAEIYMAEFTSIEGFKKILVIKKILPEFSSNSKFISMFIEEAKIAVHFNHRNIVQVFDFGKIDGEYYIAMEYVDGFDLSRLYAFYQLNHTSINISGVIFILTEMLKGLNYAHNKSENEFFQLIHRDISLNNVIVSKQGDVKLLDFGIAKTEEMSVNDDLKGKLTYMAPEQIRKEPLDARADIYATGVLGWRLLTGEKPFDLQKYKTPQSVLGVDIPKPSFFNPEIPPKLDDIIMKALEKDRSKRYQNAEQFYEALYEFAGEENILYHSFQFSSYLKKIYPILSRKLEIPLEELTAPQKLATQTNFTEMTSRSVIHCITGEARSVFLVYCDIKDLSSVFDVIPAESFDKLMSDFFKVIENVVYKYQCSILFLDNYGLSFVFGAPTSKEDDLIQAIQFSFDIYDSFYAYSKDFKLGLNISIGIERGKIVVNEVYPDMKIKMVPVDNILKNARNLAEKFPNGVYITPKLKSSVEAKYRIKAEKDSFIVLSKKEITESEMNKLFGIETIFIGRDGELDLALNLFQNVEKERKFSLLSIWGEAGVGKSRFIFEFLKRVKTNRNSLNIVKGRTLSYEGGHPYYLIMDAIRNFLGVKSLTNKKSYEKHITPYLSSIKDLHKKHEFITIIGHFIGFDYSDDDYISHIQADANILKKMQLNYIKLFFKMLSQEQFLLIVFEDLHWASDLVLSFLDELINFLQESPVCILIATREEILLRKEGWGSDYQNHTFLKLKRLSKIESETLIKSILIKIEGLPERFISEFYEKSAGIPLFIEEIIKVLIDQGIIFSKENKLCFDTEKYEQLTIPLSIESLLQARLDALLIEEKKLIQKASVIGRVFWSGALKYLVQFVKNEGETANIKNVLAQIEQKEMIFKKDYKDSVLEEEYIFKHSLLKDVVYDSMIEKERQNYHNLVAIFLEKHGKNSLQNRDAMIAFHYERARVYIKAIEYYVLAAKEAFISGGLTEEALKYYNQALGLFVHIEFPDKQLYIQILIEMARVYRFIGQYRYTLKYLEQARVQAENIDNHELLFEILTEYSEYYHLKGFSSKALLYINITKIFSNDNRTYFRILLKEAWIYYRRNQFRKSINNLNFVLKEAFNDELEYSEEIAEAYKIIAVVYAEQGKYPEAIKYSQKTIQHYLEQKNLYKTAVALNNLGEIYRDTKNSQMAHSYYKRAFELSKGNPYLKAMLLNNIGSLEIQDHNYQKGVSLLKSSIDILNEIDIFGFRYETHRLLAEATLRLEMFDEFVEHCKQAEDFSLKSRSYLNLSLVYLLWGDYYLSQDREKEGEFYYLKALELSNSIEAFVAQKEAHLKLIDFYSKRDINKKNLYDKKYRELLRYKIV